MTRLFTVSPSRRFRSLMISAICVLAVVSYVMIAPQPASMMSTFTVNSTVDSVDASPGDGSCADSLGRCTLRAAIQESNASSGANVINVPAGTYTLTLGPSDDEFNFDGAEDGFGDLDIYFNDLTIIGAGSGSTIIDGGAIDRVIDINNFSAFGPSINVSLQGLTIRNGNAPTSPEGYRQPGGGIQFDGTDNNTGLATGTLTLNDVRVTSNVAAGIGGGILSIFGSLSATNCEISNNRSTNSAGGGLLFDGGSGSGSRTLLLTGGRVTGNQATNGTFGNGAGVWAGGNATKTIDHSVITGNTAGVRGGGVFNNAGSLSLNYNVIVGNISGDPTSSGFRNNTGPVNIDFNWWGCNQGPAVSPCDRASGALGLGFGPWLTLSHTATPNTISPNQSTTLQADFFTPSSGPPVGASDLVALDGRAIVFGNPVLGTISGADPQISGGKANATFTAGASSGAGSADATVDQATVTANIQINQPPTISCPANMTTSNDADSCSASVAFSVTAGGAPAPTVTCKVGATTITSPHTFDVGTTTVQCTASNGVGDDASCSFTVTVNDTQDPTVTAPAAVSVDTGASATSCSAIVSDATLGPATAADNCPGVTIARSGVPAGNEFPVGTTVVTYTATDAHGNTASATQDVTVVDTAPPTITAPAAVTANTGPGAASCSAVVSDATLGSATANDNCPGVMISRTGVPAGNNFPVGTTVVTYTATDAHGNIASATQNVTVADNTAPVVTPPGPVSVNTGPGATSCAAFVSDATLGTGTATDNCGSATVTRTGVPAGNNFPVGTTVVTYTATDSNGNTASATQNVTVVDNTPPAFTSAPANVTAYTGPGAMSCGAMVSNAALGTATATDNCSVIVTRSGVPAGNIFPKGNTTITYTATDPSGNSVMATQTVTVIDNTPPAISCPANIVANYDPSVNGAVVTFTTPVGTDNCPGATTSQTTGLASGSTFPLGTTTNTFTVTDASGNTASCNFTVTVAVTQIVGLNSVSISGSGYVDSYNSSGGYPATKSSLANILSNGVITLGNSGKVWGSVRSTQAGVNMSGASQVTGNATAGTTVSLSGSASVGGTITNNQMGALITLPSVSACGPPYSSNSGISGTYSYNSGTGDLSLSGVNIATLANGNYCFHNITLTNSAQLKVNGPVVIKMTGTLNASGATVINNTTAVPGNLLVLSSYTGSNGVSFTNGTNAYLVIYSPGTGATIGGSAPLFGTVSANSITVSNSGAIHYDTQLNTIWPQLWSLIFGP